MTSAFNALVCDLQWEALIEVAFCVCGGGGGGGGKEGGLHSSVKFA